MNSNGSRIDTRNKWSGSENDMLVECADRGKKGAMPEPVYITNKAKEEDTRNNGQPTMNFEKKLKNKKKVGRDV